MADVRQSPCPAITYDKRSTLLNGVKIYTRDAPSENRVDGTEYHPSFIDPFYRTIIGSEELLSSLHIDDLWHDDYTFNLVSPSRGLCDMAFYTSGERDIRLPQNRPGVFSNETTYTFHKERLFAADCKTVLLDPHHPSSPLIDNKRRIIIFIKEDPVLKDYIGLFTGSIEGSYVLPSAYEAKEGLTISVGPAYGLVLLRTCPDSRFYLSFQRNEKGVLIGEFMRTRLIPLHEEKKIGEIEGCFSDFVNGHKQEVPVYLSYYDPDGSGRLITREEYETYLKKRRSVIEQETGFPNVLSDLLGFKVF